MRINVAMGWLCGLVMAVGAHAAHAQTPFERSSDKAVTKLLESIADNQKQFRRALDKTFSRSVIRSATGEVDVEAYLDDLDKAIKGVDDRFDGRYSASTEVHDLLQRAAPMQTYVRAHPELRGASEWDRVAGDLNRLGQAYGAAFPLANNANVRRIGDGELTESLTALGSVGKGVSSALKRAGRDTPALATLNKSGTESVEGLEKVAAALKSRISHGEPATAEARQLQAVAKKLDGLFGGADVPAAVKTAWQPAGEHVAKIAQAFGL